MPAHEVWDEVRRGASLTDAYAEHLRRREAAEKESELEKLRSEDVYKRQRGWPTARGSG